MYQYNETDKKILEDRVTQFRDQTERYLKGDLSEDEFLPLRLQNGLYIQRYAPLLRIGIPYGTLSSKQLRVLSSVSRKYDKGYGHISTRQNIQLNWPALDKVPDILAELAAVEMHAIQTSGSCIRVITTDEYAGAAADEFTDPRPWCEILRQWSSFHPEFAFLPRKFKIAVCASEKDRSAMRFHDIGVRIRKTDSGELCFDVYAGGGLGRTPVISSLIHESVEATDLITCLESILRVYNVKGRRDNKYKARIKILVKAMGVDAFREASQAEWDVIKNSPRAIPEAEIDRISNFFAEPDFEIFSEQNTEYTAKMEASKSFRNWVLHNTLEHKKTGYRIVNLSLKPTGAAPGDITAEQMEIVADLCDEYSMGDLRTTHQQNMVFPHVKQADLYCLWEKLAAQGLATANLNTLTDVICCPGGDFCALANAKSIPIAENIQRRFDDIDYVYDLGNLDLNISGCMNACGHHHVGHIGILGVDKKGKEFYQVSLGGSSALDASIGKILGPSFNAEDVPDIIETVINVFLDNRVEGEEFLDTYRRIGIAPFKERVYAK